jgi:hypothetical protein
MDHARAIPPKAAPFVDQLVGVGGQLQSILVHMEAAAAANGDRLTSQSVVEVLTELLGSILAPMARRRPDDAAIAASVLEEVAATIEAELFLVRLEEPHRRP